jgi:hypothetical protein
MRKLPVSLVVAALSLGGWLATAALGSDLTGSDPNPPAKPALPIDKNIRPPRDDMRVNLDVLVDGKPVRLISHKGKLYLPVSRMGCEYEIRVNNQGSRRIAAVVSVDGISVIKGDVASEKSAGYLVDPCDNVVIKGWRRDKDTVAAFTFEDRENSYAYKTGHRDNIGVIGLVAFEEQECKLRPLAEFSKDRLAAPGKACDDGVGGTGWGREIGSGVTFVPFVRSDNKRTVTIYYDTEDALRRIGVPIDGPCPKPVVVEPKPFPKDDPFCPPPPAKRGL